MRNLKGCFGEYLLKMNNKLKEYDHASKKPSKFIYWVFSVLLLLELGFQTFVYFYGV
jgi:hypothetical protein